ncbi:hypothetical protein [Methylobacterium sp. WL6]|uniref:hypothetical protein n=1 Tax=Methylobacterium sp. WL6 TaxID=2603901 RepID=UPI0011CA55FA|nr:hypothetical protein [Methylobacterium sp. WL6]TXN62481.1 hypothetical protein FV230_21750 [Methylobacterium sp. WL6]
MIDPYICQPRDTEFRTLLGALDDNLRTRTIHNLARLRVDREGGEGTYRDMLALIAAGGTGALAAQRALDRVHERAERNLSDVLAALAEGSAT